MSVGSVKDLTKGGSDDPAVVSVAARALDFVRDGARVGLGSGRASHVFIRKLGERVQNGLIAEGVPTSNSSEKLARDVGIPLIELREDVELDLIVDGADEVSPELDLVKGWGGALVRERIVASAAKRQIILVGPEKLVQRVGARGRIPVEVIPLAVGVVARHLKLLGLEPTLRLADGKPFISDNGNLTLDCAPHNPIADGKAARELEAKVLALAGVVDTGMFLGTCERVLVGQADGTIKELVRA